MEARTARVHHGGMPLPAKVTTMNTMNTLLYRCAAVWTAIGLVSGLGYRELTRSHDFVGRTQLAVVHTHTLVLGMVFFLVLLALNELFALEADRRFRIGVHVWNAGLALTSTMLAVKGSLQVLGNGAADSKAISGISGLGHMTLTAALLLLFLALGARVRAGQRTTDAAPQSVSA